MKNDKREVIVEEDIINELVNIVILNNYVDDELYEKLRKDVCLRKSEIEIDNNIYHVRCYCLEDIVAIKNIMKLDDTHEVINDFGSGIPYKEVTDEEEIDKVLEKFEMVDVI